MLKDLISKMTKRFSKQEAAPRKTAAGMPAADLPPVDVPDVSLVQLTPEQFKQLVLDVAHTHDVELACESTFDLLDQYTDLVAGGGDAEATMPLVKHHVEICPECREEYETLLAIILELGTQ